MFDLKYLRLNDVNEVKLSNSVNILILNLRRNIIWEINTLCSSKTSEFF